MTARILTGLLLLAASAGAQAQAPITLKSAVVVLSDRDDMRVVARNLIRFFADESCGQCTPCRLGTEKMLTLIERDDWDAALLDALSQVMRDASICGLGQAAPNPVQSVLRFFASGDPAR